MGNKLFMLAVFGVFVSAYALELKFVGSGTHYGDPLDGSCQPGEVNVTVQGVKGPFCSPSCTSAACPTDKPSSCTANPECALKASTGAKYCALICTPGKDDACGENASCKSISGTGICTYDK